MASVPSTSAAVDTSNELATIDRLLTAEATDVFRRMSRQILLTESDGFDTSASYRLDRPPIDVMNLVAGMLSTSTESPTRFEYRKDERTGRIVDVDEMINDRATVGTARTSMSLNRLPDYTVVNRLQGSSSNVPFLPGGMEDDLANVIRLSRIAHDNKYGNSVDLKYLDFNGDLLTCPPGFKNGFDFGDKKSTNNEETSIDQQNEQNCVDDSLDLFSLLDIVAGGDGMIFTEETKQKDIVVTQPSPIVNAETTNLETILSRPVVIVPAPSLIQPSSTSSDYKYSVYLDSSRNWSAYKEFLSNMQLNYPFDLDPFQQQAIRCLESADSVFVSAHTSAGKTVIAECAIALCRAHQTRVIYTSPIKALSNQKFRDFKILFDDVGLVTGDLQLNSDAFCLIMTTEILRSMLYNGSEVIRELEWVIFDEVHYINDTEVRVFYYKRGHVWEEVLIMLPSHVNLIMLSATAPNCLEFADWVGRIKNRKIYVVTTQRRPVPLEHFLYTGQDGKTKNDRFLIVDTNVKFQARGFTLASQAKSNLKKSISGPKGYRPNNKSDKLVYISLIDHLRSQNLLPMVVFVFSRKRCDENAALLTSVDLTTQAEKSEVHTFFGKCISRLKGSDKKLPQVLEMQEYCKRGFAIHHSGILPILKEVVEMLFQRGFVKVLFATETFAMGVNMPARTVVFDSMQKHDGQRLRCLNPGEYLQMAGRAGRRGLDTTGTVILMCKGAELPDITDLTSMMLGQPTRLESKFRVTYGMLLNLLRVEQLRIEDMLQRSYVECAALRQGAARKDQLQKIEIDIKESKPINCKLCVDGKLADYHTELRKFLHKRFTLWPKLARLPIVDKTIAPGRLVIVSHAPTVHSRLALILKTKDEAGSIIMHLLVTIDSDDLQSMKEAENDWSKMSDNERNWLTESMLVDDSAAFGIEQLAIDDRKSSSKRIYRVLENVRITSLIAITNKMVKVDASALLEDWLMRQLPKFRSRSPDPSIQRLIIELDTIADDWRRDGVPALIAGQQYQCTDVDLFQQVHEIGQLRAKLTDATSFTCRRCISFREHLRQHRELVRLSEQRDLLKYQLSTESLLLSKDYQDRIQVLRALHYIDDDNMVELKGKVACEIHHQELLITELMLDNRFESLEPAEVAAMLSATTCQYKMSRSGDQTQSESRPLKANLVKLRDDVIEISERINRVNRECGVLMCDIGEELNFDLIEIVYEWANGVPFAQLMTMTEAQEGLIVRCIQRLDEVCKDVRNAARIVGDPSLREKMEATSTAIKRDIVFAASLYTVT